MGIRVAAFNLLHSPDGVNPSTDGVRFDGSTPWGTSVFSQPFYVESVGTLAVQVSCPATGTPSGSFAFQGSLDASAQENRRLPDVNLVNWGTLSFFDEATGVTVQSKTVSGAQSFIATIQVVSPRWIRFAWTNTSGQASLTVRAQEKSVS